MRVSLVGSVGLGLGLGLLGACGEGDGRELGDTQMPTGEGAETSTQTSAGAETSTGDSASEGMGSEESGSEESGSEESDSDATQSGDGDGDAEPGFCGDGVVSDGEVCDDGINDGSYGACNPGCTSFGPYCGDAMVNGPEACDDGNQDPTDTCLDTCIVATSCATIHDADQNLGDGFYSLLPVGFEGEPFQVYCDMSTQGGGWAVIFKNHGGASPGERSNDALLDGDPGPYAGVITPHSFELESGVNAEAWAWYRGAAGHDWLKLGTLYDPRDQVVHEQLIRADFGEAVTWNWILTRPSGEYCNLAPNPIVLVANGDTPLGQTTYVNSYQADRRTFGLANTGADTDRCGQSEDNLISDPEQALAWFEGYSFGGIRHFFSYVHTSTGQDASRCQFACWDQSSAGYYDGFTWLVR